MAKTERDSASDSPSPSSSNSDTGKGMSVHAARYAKVYGFFGFNRGYNFPLCMSDRTCFMDYLPRLTSREFQGSFLPVACWVSPSLVCQI
jgi:hypothetical protein